MLLWLGGCRFGLWLGLRLCGFEHARHELRAEQPMVRSNAFNQGNGATQRLTISTQDALYQGIKLCGVRCVATGTKVTA